MFSPDDTIVAIATPPGRGGIGVIRLSGGDATRIARALIQHEGPLEPRRATFARAVQAVSDDRLGVIDTVVVTFFARPHSYTGEDVVEISGHGSPVLLRQIQSRAMVLGARLAEPGEFTLRAYLGGKLDLIQAEAVRDLIEAVTPRQARAAMDQLDGTLTSAIHEADRELFELCAKLEASLDFPDEGFHFITRDEARHGLVSVENALSTLVTRGRTGRLIRDGRRVVILGRPNTGKSTLFNALVGAERAIVASTPGTTRDVVSEIIDVHGIPVTLVDTAGLRESDDAVEQEGVARARAASRAADFVVAVIDGSQPIGDADRSIAREIGARPGVIAVSKSDLGQAWPLELLGSDVRAQRVSAANGTGIEAMLAAIAGPAFATEHLRDGPTVTNARHVSVLDNALASLANARGILDDGGTEELVLAEMTDARSYLEEITGQRTPDDVLREIFEKFCVGK